MCSWPSPCKTHIFVCVGWVGAEGRVGSTATPLTRPSNNFGLERGQGSIRRERTSEVAPEVVRQAVGGGRQSGWRRLLSVTNAIEAGTCRPGDGGWAFAGHPGGGGGGTTPHSTASVNGGGVPHIRNQHVAYGRGGKFTSFTHRPSSSDLLPAPTP